MVCLRVRGNTFSVGQFHIQRYQNCGKWTSGISSGVCYWRKLIGDARSAYHVRGVVLYVLLTRAVRLKVNSLSLAFIDLPFGSVMMTPKLPPSSEFIQVLVGLMLRRACVGGRPRSLLLWHMVSLGAQPPFCYRLDMLVWRCLQVSPALDSVVVAVDLLLPRESPLGHHRCARSSLQCCIESDDSRIPKWG